MSRGRFENVTTTKVLNRHATHGSCVCVKKADEEGGSAPGSVRCDSDYNASAEESGGSSLGSHDDSSSEEDGCAACGRRLFGPSVNAALLDGDEHEEVGRGCVSSA